MAIFHERKKAGRQFRQHAVIAGRSRLMDIKVGGSGLARFRYRSAGSLIDVRLSMRQTNKAWCLYNKQFERSIRLLPRRLDVIRVEAVNLQSEFQAFLESTAISCNDAIVK